MSEDLDRPNPVPRFIHDDTVMSLNQIGDTVFKIKNIMRRNLTPAHKVEKIEKVLYEMEAGKARIENKETD